MPTGLVGGYAVNHAVTCLGEIYLTAVGFSANTCERIDAVNVQNVSFSMRRMDMSANTFYRRVREYEIRHGIIEQTSA